jgi:hypothetical protein
VKQDFLRQADRRGISCAAAEVSNGEPTEIWHLGPCTPTASRRTASQSLCIMICSYGEPTESELHIVARNFVRTYGKPTELFDRNSSYGNPTEGLRKFWVRNVSDEQTGNLHFGRFVTSDVHSRLAAAGRVQGVGGSVTFTPHLPPAKIDGRSRWLKGCEVAPRIAPVGAGREQAARVRRRRPAVRVTCGLHRPGGRTGSLPGPDR